MKRVAALSGGVGGARLLDGLAAALPAGALTCVVNTGDDFVHWGLHVSPDLDTCMYTLAGLSDEAQGWGVAGETFGALALVERYGGASWFRLGDRDLATHIVRSEALAAGETLTAVTERLCRALGVPARVLPMADLPRRTVIETAADGALPFQEWFVRRRARPEVTGVRFEGTAAPSPEALDAVAAADLVVIGPSNPYVSIDPILGLAGMVDAMAGKPVVAVSPIVSGRAVKGPLADMIRSITGEPPSAAAIARHYGALLSAMVVETGDGAELPPLPVLETSTVMHDRADRRRLAEEVLELGLGRSAPRS